MNKKYEIKYSSLFYKDLSSILHYIKYELQNPNASQLLLEEILKEIRNRSDNPESYEKYFSQKHRKNTYYRIYVKNYIVFYTVKENKMEIRRLLYQKRNFREFL